MHKGRVEAFSDAVIAIALTIMVLEFKPPHEVTLDSLKPLLPEFGGYVLSFVYLGIYWNNHHHMFQVAKHVNGAVLWANMHLLFWLSLVPFVTSWMGEHALSTGPVVAYGFVLLMAGVAYYVLTLCLLGAHSRDSDFAKALGSDAKGKVSIVIYVVAIGLAFASPIAACVLYGCVAIMWLVPDKRFERVAMMAGKSHGGD